MTNLASSSFQADIASEVPRNSGHHRCWAQEGLSCYTAYLILCRAYRDTYSGLL